MNNNMLVSTAMLSTYWEKEKRDTLDLLKPFVKYSIAKTTKVNETINTSKVVEFFKREFGYETILTNVIIQIFKRLSPSILKKSNSNFILKVSLDKEVDSFEKNNLRFMEHNTKVGNTLAEFLNNSSLKASYDKDKALHELITFFATNGLCIIKDADMLELIKRKDDSIRYAIAQFIIQEHSNNTEIFKYIEEMVKGFFVSSAIAFYAQNSAPIDAKFKNLSCYIDTRIIINALGLRLPEEQKPAQELLKMLIDKGAQLCCFEHTFGEINDIITAYRNGLKYPKNNYNHPTLEGWDSQKYNITDVDNYQRLLKNKIENLGIKIVPRPQITNIKLYPFNDNILSEHIKSYINYKNDDALQCDIFSIASIFILRNNLKTLEIEKSHAIFVTSNINLTKAVTIFLNNNNICDFATETSPIITDLDLSSIVWLKCFSTHKDFPKHRLIELSMAALEPTSSILSVFYDFIDKIKADGGITEDEASIIRTDAFCRKLLSESAKGNFENITNETVFDIKERLRKEYVGAADDKTKLSLQKYTEEKEKRRDNYRKAIEKIKAFDKRIYNISYSALYTLSLTIIAIFLALSLMSAINAFDGNSGIMLGVISLIIGLAGTIDMFISKLGFVKKLIRIASRKIAAYFSDKKKEDYESILGEFIDISSN